MRIAVGGIRHETNTFSTLRTGIADFSVLRGDEITSRLGRFEGVEWAPTLLAYAPPHGLVEKKAYLELRDELLARLRESMPVDGVYLSLHGAMEVEGIGDGETDLVRAVREVVGEGVPIAASLDLHANLSYEVGRLTDLLTAYRTAPHVDAARTTERAIRKLMRCLREGLRPVNAVIKLPLILPGEYAVTEVEPARSIYARLEEAEKEPGIMDASILIGCAWTDSPHTSVTVVVVAEDRGSEGRAREMARELADLIWSKRKEFGPEAETLLPDEAIEAAMASKERPVFISDSGDNVTAGGAGDVPVMLERAIRIGADGLVVAGLTDPEAVEMCRLTGEGREVELRVGGKLDPINGYPLKIRGRVERVIPGRLAVVRIDGVQLVLLSERRAMVDLKSFEEAGIDPRESRAVVVKVGLLFSDARRIAAKAIMALTPGFTCLELERLPYRRLRRPIYPLDGDFEWQPCFESEVMG